MTNQLLQSPALFFRKVNWYLHGQTRSLLFLCMVCFPSVGIHAVSCPKLCVWAGVWISCVLKGVCRGEVECESVTPTVLTVTEGCRSSGRGESQTSVLVIMCSIPSLTICWHWHLKNFCTSGTPWILFSLEIASGYILALRIAFLA